MNKTFLARFSSTWKTNPVWSMVQEFKNHPTFKGARVDVYSASSNPQNIIILLGQVHTVWKGKISNRQRKQIVNCQTRLASYYAFFLENYRVKRFGGEGIYEGLDTSFSDQHAYKLYQQAEKQLNIHHSSSIKTLTASAQQIFSYLGKQWQQEIRTQHSPQLIQQLAAAISGQTLMNYLTEDSLETYPVEHQQAYQHVLVGIKQLGAQIKKLEKTQEMRFVTQRGGKAKTQKEASIVAQYNTLVKEHNRLISSDIRERATLSLMLQEVKKSSPVVFTMGIGHRRNYLKLCPEVLRNHQTAFVLITAPELRVSWFVKIAVPLAILFLSILFLVWSS